MPILTERGRRIANSLYYKGVSNFLTGGLRLTGLTPEVEGRGKGSRKRGRIKGAPAIEAVMRGADAHWRRKRTIKAKLRLRKTRGPDKGKHRLLSRNVRI